MAAAALASAAAVMVSTAPAHSEPPSWQGEHAHLHLTGVEVDGDGNPTSIQKCTPFANGQVVPRNAHHENLHIGRAGEAQWEAGNAVVPVLPGRTPWTDCESLLDFFFGS